MKSCDFMGKFYTFVHEMVWPTFIGFQHVHWMLSPSITLVKKISTPICAFGPLRLMPIYVVCRDFGWLPKLQETTLMGPLFHFGLFFNHVLGLLA